MEASNLAVGTSFFSILFFKYLLLNKEMKRLPAYLQHHDDRGNWPLIIIERLLLVCGCFLDSKCKVGSNPVIMEIVCRPEQLKGETLLSCKMFKN